MNIIASLPPPPSIEVTGFVRDFKSPFFRRYKMHFSQNGESRAANIGLYHSSVAVLLYHRERRQFLVVRQFRPAIFASLVLRLPENAGKRAEEIGWNSYNRELGCTLELCAGLVDKSKDLKEIAREEMEEECGYSLPSEHIHHIATYRVSDTPQHLFYAEIDDSCRVSDGGGNASEGECIEKIWLREDEACNIRYSKHQCCPPGFRYAFAWWFDRADSARPGELPKEIWPISSDPFPSKALKMDNIHFEDAAIDCGDCNVLRMKYTINGIARAWDMDLKRDVLAVLLYSQERDGFLLTQRFCPGALVEWTRHHSGHVVGGARDQSTDLAALPWDTVAPERAYTLEVCSETIDNRDETPAITDDLAPMVVDCVAKGVGYRISPDTVAKICATPIGIGSGGEWLHAYFAEIRADQKMEKFEESEDRKPALISRESAKRLLLAPSPPSRPVLLYMLRWFFNNQPSQ